MHERAFHRAVALSAAALLLAVGAAFADTVAADTDAIVAGLQPVTDLGLVAPGAVLTENVAFELVCSGTSHVAAGQTVAVAYFGSTLGTQGAVWPDGAASATAGSIGPVSGWVADGASCSSPAERFTTGSPSVVTITAPSVPSQHGQYYRVDLLYSTTAAGVNSGRMLFAGAAFTFAVSGDLPPTLHLPGPMTVEGNITGGATVTYTATASDAEDVSPPPVSCSPASGAFFGLGLTSVDCSATDSAGQTTSGSFDVTVVDTTPPVLSGVPSGLSLVTYDPAGAAASYALPSAADVVDATPSVACDPAPGSVLPVGTTTVTCKATDHSGNQASASFIATVTYVRLAATFEPPIGPSNVVAFNPGRTLPVKAAVTRDGVPVTNGSVSLSLATCDGTPLRAAVPLTFQTDRWFLGLDTSGLTGCVAGTLALDGHVAGSFEMGASSSALAGPKPGRH